MTQIEAFGQQLAGSVTPFFVEEPLFEVVDGQEVAKPLMGVFEGSLAAILHGELFVYLKQANLGRVVCEILFRIYPDKSRMRRPDVAFVSYKRWGRDQKLSSGNGWDVVPDLAVEVVSPTDLAGEVMTKVQEYLDAGVARIWVVYPGVRQVHIFEGSESVRIVGPNGTLAGEDLLPGFAISMAELFRDGPDLEAVK